MIRPPVFVDTSAWYALVRTQAAEHRVAVEAFERLAAERRRLVTTNHVIAESYTLVLVRAGHAAAQTFLRRVRASPVLARLHVPEAWEEAAEEMLTQFDDQPFSYVDATSFIAMRRLGLSEAFAYDRHFATAGSPSSSGRSA